MTSIASPPEPLQAVIPSYVYQQYADDENIVAFVSSFNGLAQGYLDWFNATPLAVYTSPQIAGPLLDWVGNGLYGVSRPVFSSGSTAYLAGLNAFPLNRVALNGHRFLQSGTATVASDDYYKRVLTWTTYAGDGRFFTCDMFRKRIARFLYGVSGTDISLSQAQQVSVTAGAVPGPIAPTLSQVAEGTLSARVYGCRETYVTPLGESLAGGASSLSVAADNVLAASSPPARNGATAYNIYVGVLSTNPSKFIAGLNGQFLTNAPLNGTNKRAVLPMTRQNASPIPIGLAWTEPTTGLVAGAPLPQTDLSNQPQNLLVTIPSGTPSAIFRQALSQGILGFPFQLTASINYGGATNSIFGVAEMAQDNQTMTANGTVTTERVGTADMVQAPQIMVAAGSSNTGWGASHWGLSGWGE